MDDEGDDEAPEIDNGVLPDPMQLEWFRKYRMDEAKAMSVFRSLTFFVAFLVVLAVVCYGNRDYNHYIIAQEARAILPKVTEVGVLYRFGNDEVPFYGPFITQISSRFTYYYKVKAPQTATTSSLLISFISPTPPTNECMKVRAVTAKASYVL